ncbi:hypothetical protein Q5752_006988 [Cryptotrichosporon argae]
MPFGASHKPLVALANSAVSSFFRKIEVYGSENVPEEGPIIFACTHANMAVDPAVLSSTIPHAHYLHYWVKDSLFANPAVGAMLRNAGNIPVDRKTKNNQMLFRGTFEALAQGECIGVFPEGTSHTEPHMIALKDGVAWAALEYVRYLRGTEENKGPKTGKKACIVPVGIVYCDKSKYRSRVVVHYAKPIRVEDYEEEFLSEKEGASKAAVKRMTKKIEQELLEITVNAPDWDTAFAAQMTRELLWQDEDRLPLSDYVPVAQTLVDLFSTTGDRRIDSLKELLVTYNRLLFSSRLSNTALTEVPLPRTLDPSARVSMPDRLSTLLLLVRDTLACLIRLPFFLLPMLFHIPVYLIGIFGASMAEDELETQAQMKIFLGLALSFLTYPVVFFALWAMFRQVPLGAAVAAGGVWLLGQYHTALIDQNYNAAKRLVAAWRLLVGVWLPREMSLSSFIASARTFAPDPPAVAGLGPNQKPERYVRPPRVPSRALVRHVLRVRIDAARALAAALLELEAADAPVDASPWLARQFGGDILDPPSHADTPDGTHVEHKGKGRRSGKEVVNYLRTRGARLGQAAGTDSDAHWAASSGDEEDRKDI